MKTLAELADERTAACRHSGGLCRACACALARDWHEARLREACGDGPANDLDAAGDRVRVVVAWAASIAAASPEGRLPTQAERDRDEMLALAASLSAEVAHLRAAVAWHARESGHQAEYGRGYRDGAKAVKAAFREAVDRSERSGLVSLDAVEKAVKAAGEGL